MTGSSYDEETKIKNLYYEDKQNTLAILKSVFILRTDHFSIMYTYVLSIDTL